MPIDIGFGKGFRKWEYVFTLKPDEYYWALSPEIDHLLDTTGKYIDLYGSVKFMPHEFVHLEKLVADARIRVGQMPEIWDQFVYRQTVPVKKDIFKAVKKDNLLQALGTLEMMIVEAKDKNTGVVFLGD